MSPSPAVRVRVVLGMTDVEQVRNFDMLRTFSSVSRMVAVVCDPNGHLLQLPDRGVFLRLP